MKKSTLSFLFIFATVFGIYGSKGYIPGIKTVSMFPFSFTSPVFITPAPWSIREARSYIIVEKKGYLKYAYPTVQKENLTWQNSTLIDIHKKVCSKGWEEGLLGLAFDPDFESNKSLYIYYSVCKPRKTRLSRLVLTENAADWNPETGQLSFKEEVLFEIDQPYGNHNGGHIEFGPDGYLYIGVGDGGSAGDPHNNGQNLNTKLGKILRVDVSNQQGYSIPKDNPFLTSEAPEIFAYGLRNPWRFSFDRLTGKLWVGDVGQNEYEEVSIIEKGKNYGWHILEGTHCYNPAVNCKRAGLENPIYEYTHEMGASITGGYVYRGKNIPELHGLYIFGDFVEGRIWAISQNGAKQNLASLVVDTSIYISSFGLDVDGELLIVGFTSGRIYRLEK
ncbi:MAG: PQQ-dependent sugar dehydrogenase [Leptospirales bacterium]